MAKQIMFANIKYILSLKNNFFVSIFNACKGWRYKKIASSKTKNGSAPPTKAATISFEKKGHFVSPAISPLVSYQYAKQKEK